MCDHALFCSFSHINLISIYTDKTRGEIFPAAIRD
ncbi:hypothetical protein EVA_09669 [gut metagenome]|uniref:Uncharacterized protein n=1 Tax=gut metagenome TaxID=749906 RepID=J9G5S4_9ZZZZ